LLGVFAFFRAPLKYVDIELELPWLLRNASG
jgi:hypothetical protein